MEMPSRHELRELASFNAKPAVTIYQPLHRTYPDRRQDPIRFRDLMDQAQQGLIGCGIRESDAEKLLEPGRRLKEDEDRWRAGEADGLALLLAPKFFRTYRLPFQCQESVDVGEQFYIVPLARSLELDQQFHVLALSPKRIRLFRCDSRQMNTEDLPPNMPKTLDEMYGDTEIEKSLQYHTSAGFGTTGSLSGTPHGHGDPRDDSTQLLDDFFHRIARDLEPTFQREKLPVIVAAVDYYHPMFRKACHYRDLMDEGVTGSPDELSEQEILDRARPIAHRWNRRDVEQAKTRYRQAKAAGKTSAKLEAIIPLAREGRIATLFVAQDLRRWGTLDPPDGPTELHEQRQPGDVDFLDVAVRQTLAHDGEIYVVPPDEVPDAGLSGAVLRW